MCQWLKNVSAWLKIEPTHPMKHQSMKKIKGCFIGRKREDEKRGGGTLQKKSPLGKCVSKKIVTKVFTRVDVIEVD